MNQPQSIVNQPQSIAWLTALALIVGLLTWLAAPSGAHAEPPRGAVSAERLPEVMAAENLEGEASATSAQVAVVAHSVDVSADSAAGDAAVDRWVTTPAWAGAVGPASCTECWSRAHCRASCGGFCGRDVGLHCGDDPDRVYCFCGF